MHVEYFASGVTRQQTTHLLDPEHVYRQILADNPNHVEALHMLGVHARQAGNHQAAVELIQRAITLNSTEVTFHNNLGNAFKSQGKLDEAIGCYLRAIELDPNVAEIHNNLGIAFAAQGKLDDAVESYSRALERKPDFAEAHHNLGNALQCQGDLVRAVECYHRAVSLNAGFAEAYNSLGNAFKAQGKLDAAVQSYRRAIDAQPDFAEFHNNLGIAFTDQGKLDDAVTRYRRAVELKPGFANAHSNLGMVYTYQGRLDEAIAHYRKAVELQPDFAEAQCGLGRALLKAGNFPAGWLNFDARIKSIPLPSFRKPIWDGSPLHGRRILLCAEQGLGDTLQFIRYAPLVKVRGGHVIVACQPQLRKLLADCDGIDELVSLPQKSSDPLPPFDVYVHLISLPRVLNTTIETIPSAVPYLQPNKSLCHFWRKELAHIHEVKVGIVWQGSRLYRDDRARSINLLEFESIKDVQGIRLFSLQKGEASKQISQLKGRLDITDYTDRMDESTGPFLDTAAMMANLDLVITCDTSIAHLAGALGVPVWVALNHASEWRWLTEREDSPWYPTMRLFRQETAGDWNSVFCRIARELQQFEIHKRSTAKSLLHLLPPGVPKSALVETSFGELADKLTILQIKAVRISERSKLENVSRELETVRCSFDAAIGPFLELPELCAPLDELISQLTCVNEKLWQIENDIRHCERTREFGPKFVELARSIYRQNDRRADLKREINDLLGSRIVEEKSYQIDDVQTDSLHDPE